MENNLPKGWEIKKLVERIPIVKTGVDKFDGVKPYYSTGSVSGDSMIPEGKFAFKNRPARANRLLLENDVVQARMRESQKAVLIDKNLHGSLFSTGFLQFRPEKQNYNSKLLYYYLRSDKFLKQRDEYATGSTQVALTDKGAENIDLIIPPQAYQKRIADKLDTLLAKVKDAQSRLDRIPLILKRFRQSVLAAACSGRLTADWRDNKTDDQLDNIDILADLRAMEDVEELFETPKTWRWIPLQAICDPKRSICYGVIKLGHEHDNGVPCLRTSDVKPLDIDISDVKRIKPEISAKYERTLLRGGEVLVNVRGTLGGVAVVSERLQGWNVSREVAVVPVLNSLPKFVAFWIASIPCQNWLNGVAKGVAYTGINIKDLKILPIALPSREEQKEIIRRVTELFALADNIEGRYSKAKVYTDKLEQSILAKAFRGELVMQEKN